MPGQTSLPRQTQAQTQTTNYLIPTIIIGILFFVFGFVTWLNSTLINFLKIACEIDNNVVLFFVTFAFYISYFVMAIPSSWVLKVTGFKKGMSVGLVVMAVGALIFIPAATSRTYGLFLLGLFIQGTGLAVLQTASNPYITILGPIESAAKRISIMGIFNKVAGAISPLILSAAILSGADILEKKISVATDAAEKAQLLNGLAAKVIGPYIIMAIVLFLLAIWIWFSNLPEVDQKEEEEEEDDPEIKQRRSIFQFPHLWLGVIALFFYVGCEVLAGDTIGQYGRMLGYDISHYQNFTTYTLSFMVIGYIIGIILIPKYVTQRKALQFCSILALVFSICAIFTSGWVTVFFITLLGLANAVMWPAIWPLALNKLGHFTKTGAALLVMAIAGAAVLPLIWGAIANKTTDHPQWAYILLIPSYTVILYFATGGYLAGLKKKNLLKEEVTV
ncbi:MAG: glucose/galactose MFS transporter [Chitinophagaceae bacterium]|nr:MAG: glucose/galactose MFS transporter [Chitinophagaceae bacterium]